jgi:hypothetical protein
MEIEDFSHGVTASRLIWAGVLLVWVLTEYAVMHLQVKRQLHQLSSIAFYYRPLMITLPLAIGFITWRRLEKGINLSSSGNREQLSRGMGSVTLISYVTLLAALLDLS